MMILRLEKYYSGRVIRIVMLVMLTTGSMSSLMAQSIPLVRVNPHSRVGQPTAPFDRYFYLLLPVDSSLQLDELKQVSLYKSTKKSRSQHLPGDVIKNYDTTYLKGAWFVDTPKEAGVKYLQIFIDTQFLPNTRFSVILWLMPTHNYLDKLNEVNADIYNGKGDVTKAKKKYHDLASGLKIKYSSALEESWPPFDKGDNDQVYSRASGDDNYLQYYLDNLAPLYQDVFTEDTAISNNLKRLSDTIRSTHFRMSELFECNCEKDFVAKELFSDSTKFLIPLHNLLNVPYALSYFAAGQLNIQTFQQYEKADKHELQKRIDNLGRLKTSLVNISYFFHLSSFADRIADTVKMGIYNSVQSALVAIDGRIKALKEDYANIRVRLNGEYSLFSAEIAYGNTAPYGQDIKTSSGNYVIADFGLASAGTIVNNQFGYTLLPYLGVNFSFIAIDKSQPLNAIENKRFLHKLSFVLGLTTTALSRQGTYDLIRSMSVVGGFAYRWSRSFRTTFGTLVYKRNNPNPLLPERVTVGPMVALSLDLDIANWFSTLQGKLF